MIQNSHRTCFKTSKFNPFKQDHSWTEMKHITGACTKVYFVQKFVLRSMQFHNIKIKNYKMA